MKPMDQKAFARQLRHCQTTYEELLWQLLRNRRRCNKKFRRQHPIGVYIADFYCAEEHLVIEVDGRDHFTDEGQRYDAARDRFMGSQRTAIGASHLLNCDWCQAAIACLLRLGRSQLRSVKLLDVMKMPGRTGLSASDYCRNQLIRCVTR